MEGSRGQEKILISLAPILAGTAASGYISQVAISARGITPPAGILEFWLFLGSGNGPGCLVLHAATAVGVGLPD